MISVKGAICLLAILNFDLSSGQFMGGLGGMGNYEYYNRVIFSNI